MKAILQWLIQSDTFKRYSKSIGGIALGLWIGQHYHHQIRTALAAFGITGDQWSDTLFAVAAAAFVGGSHVLSWLSDKQDAQADAPPAAKPEAKP